MKKIILPLIAIAALVSCNEADDKKENSLIEHSEQIAEDHQAKEDSIATAEATPEKDIAYVSLWNSSLRKSNPKGFKWTSSKVKYGRSMKFLRDSLVGKKTFCLVELVNGKQGWINDYVVAKEAKTAIVVSTASFYEEADILAVPKGKLSVGDIVVVYDKTIGDYSEFVTQEKKTKGFIKSAGAISFEPTDIGAGVAYGYAIGLEGATEKTKALEEFLENESYKSSIFGDKAQALLDEGIEDPEVEAIVDSISEKIMDAAQEDVEGAVEDAKDAVEDLGL